jgi:hypothetical protein
MRMFTAELSGQRVLLALLFTLGLTLVAPGLLGSPVLPCPVASVATYLTLGQCTIEGFTFEDFTFSESSNASLSPSQITVNPTFSTPSSVSFQFFGAFSSVADQTEEYIVQYELDPVLPQIVAQSIDLGPADPVTLIGQFCGNGTLGAYVAGSPANCSGTNESGIFPLNLTVTSSDGSSKTTPPALFPLIATDVDTRLVLDLVGQSSTTYFGTNAELTGVPEPSTSLWLAPGMLALFWLRKKWLANAR